jgi:hypothetical protein
MKDYVKFHAKTEAVLEGAYFWSPKFMPSLENVRPCEAPLDVAIFEPNLAQAKSCYMSIIIAERAQAYFNNVYVMNSNSLLDKPQMRNWLQSSELF